MRTDGARTRDLRRDRPEVLEPLLDLVGDDTVVGLGDGTHGTYEFSTVKLRIIDFLVREKNFDVVALEAAFPVMNRINTYVQGGPGDPRAILRDAATRLGYYFWATEEMVEVIEWMREYNEQRGDRPAIELAGVDAADDSRGIVAARLSRRALRRLHHFRAGSRDETMAGGTLWAR